MEKYIIAAIVLLIVLDISFVIYALTTDKIIRELTLDKERLEKENNHFRRELGYKSSKLRAYDNVVREKYEAVQVVDSFIVNAEKTRDGGKQLNEHLKEEFSRQLGRKLVNYATIRQDYDLSTGHGIAYRLTFDFWHKEAKENDV